MAKKKKFTNVYSEANERKIIKEASKYDSIQSVEMLLKYWNDTGALQSPVPNKKDNPLKTIPRYRPVIPKTFKNQEDGGSNETRYNDDGSRESGCTDIYAINFNPDFTDDDGSCCYDNECLILQGLDPIYGTEVGGGIPGDANNDGLLNVQDIIEIINCILGDGGNPNFDTSQCEAVPGYYIPPYNDCEDGGNCIYTCEAIGTGLITCPDGTCDFEGPNACASCPETCVGCDWETLSQDQFFEALTEYMYPGYSPDQGHNVFPAGPYTDLQSWIIYQAGSINDWSVFVDMFSGFFINLVSGVFPGIGTNFIDNYCPSLPVLGCTDVSACNTNPSAEQNDGSCIYPPYGIGCDCNNLEVIGNCWNNNVPYCQENLCDEVITGCMDSSACNYDPLANFSCDSTADPEPSSGGPIGNHCRFTNPNSNQLCPCGNWMDFDFDITTCHFENEEIQRSCNYEFFGEMITPTDSGKNFKIDSSWEGAHPSQGNRWIRQKNNRRQIHPGYGDSQQQRATLDRYCLETCNGTPTSYEENIGWSYGTNPQSASSGQNGFQYYETSSPWYGRMWFDKPWNNSGALVPDDDAWIDCNCQEEIPGVCEWEDEAQVTSTPGPNDCCCYIGDSTSFDGNECELDLSADGICACDGTINYGCGCDNIQKQTYYLDQDGDGFGCQNQSQELCPSNELVVSGAFVLNYDDSDCECPNTCNTNPDGGFMGSIFRIPNDPSNLCKKCSNPGGPIQSQFLVATDIEEHTECCALSYGGIAEDYLVVEIDYNDNTNECASGTNAVTGYECININDEITSSCINDCGVCEPGVDTFLNLSCSGCTNENACNYDSSAIFNDGSCVLPTPTTCYHQYEFGQCIYGEYTTDHWCNNSLTEESCIDNQPGQNCNWILQNPNECYDSTVSVDLCAGDCTLLGDGWFDSLSNSVIEIDCTDSTACNYTDPTSYNDCYINLNICDYPENGYDCNGNCLVGIEDCAGVCNGDSSIDDCGVCRLYGNDYTGVCVFGTLEDYVTDHWCNGRLTEEDCIDNEDWQSCIWLPSTDKDECGVCFGNNELDLGCGCNESAISMWWPDDDSDGLAQGVGVLKCSVIGTITPNTCGDGTGDCLVPDSGWEDHCSNLDTTTNTCNEEQDPNCDANTYDCEGTCEGTVVVDECGNCGGTCVTGNYGTCTGTEEIQLSTCGVCGGSEPAEHYDCNGECIESTDRYGDCCLSTDLDTCNICFGTNDKDLCGVCIVDGGDNSTCSGCTDPNATNYDSSAIVDNGTCQYIGGCTDSTADNYDDSATADDGTCCNFTDLTNQQALACNYLIDNSTYCEGENATTYYDLHCTNSADFVDASTHVPTDSVDSFIGNTPSVELQFPYSPLTLSNFNYVGYTLQNSKPISIINDSFYNEQPLSFTEFGGTLEEYDTYLQGIKADINDDYQGLTIQINEGSSLVGYTYWGTMAIYFGEAQNGWVIPDGSNGQFNSGQGFFIGSASFPGTYLKFYLESS